MKSVHLSSSYDAAEIRRQCWKYFRLHLRCRKGDPKMPKLENMQAWFEFWMTLAQRKWQKALFKLNKATTGDTLCPSHTLAGIQKDIYTYYIKREGVDGFGWVAICAELNQSTRQPISPPTPPGIFGPKMEVWQLTLIHRLGTHVCVLCLCVYFANLLDRNTPLTHLAHLLYKTQHGRRGETNGCRTFWADMGWRVEGTRKDTGRQVNWRSSCRAWWQTSPEGSQNSRRTHRRHRCVVLRWDFNPFLAHLLQILCRTWVCVCVCECVTVFPRVAKWKSRVNSGRQRGDFGVTILYEFLITEISCLPLQYVSCFPFRPFFWRKGGTGFDKWTTK